MSLAERLRPPADHIEIIDACIREAMACRPAHDSGRAYATWRRWLDELLDRRLAAERRGR
jgi:hypothetical protein